MSDQCMALCGFPMIVEWGKSFHSISKDFYQSHEVPETTVGHGAENEVSSEILLDPTLTLRLVL